MTTQQGQSGWSPELRSYRDSFRQHMTGNPVSAKMCQAIFEAATSDTRISALARAVSDEYDSSDLYNRNLVSKAELFVLGYRVPKLSHGSHSFFRRCDPIRKYFLSGGPHRPPDQKNEPRAHYIAQYIGRRINNIGRINTAREQISPLCAIFGARIFPHCSVDEPTISVDLDRISRQDREYYGLSLTVVMEADRFRCEKNDEDEMLGGLRTQFISLARTATRDLETDPTPGKIDVTQWRTTDDQLRFGIKLNPMERESW